MKRTGGAAGSAACLLGLWLLFAGTLDPAEVVLAGAASVAVVAVTLALREHAEATGRWERRWWRAAPQTATRAYRDCLTLTREVLRRLRGAPSRGRFERHPFGVGGGDPEARVRRALASFAATAAPNTYVVGFDHATSEVVVHALVPSDEHPVPDALRSEP